MAKMTIYVLDELMRRMRKVVNVSWSALAQDAFAKHLNVVVIRRSRLVQRRKRESSETKLAKTV